MIPCTDTVVAWWSTRDLCRPRRGLSKSHMEQRTDDDGDFSIFPVWSWSYILDCLCSSLEPEHPPTFRVRRPNHPKMHAVGSRNEFSSWVGSPGQSLVANSVHGWDNDTMCKFHHFRLYKFKDSSHETLCRIHGLFLDHSFTSAQ